jgi:hypothetical protein
MNPEESIGTLICTLVDRRSSVPLSDARVTCISSSGIIQVDVDSRGEFQATFPQGVYELIISARGELSLTLRGIGILAGHTQHLMRAFVPGEDDGYDGVPSSALGGYLTDRLGQPVVGAAITAALVTERPSYAIGAASSQTYTAQSDKFGAYVIHAIKPGTYDVTIRTTNRLLSNERITISAERHFERHDQRFIAL